MKHCLLAVCLLVSCAGVAADPLYLLPSDADMLHLLAPPPAADSAIQREDLHAVIEAAGPGWLAPALNAIESGVPFAVKSATLWLLP